MIYLKSHSINSKIFSEITDGITYVVLRNFNSRIRYVRELVNWTHYLTKKIIVIVKQIVDILTFISCDTFNQNNIYYIELQDKGYYCLK